MLSRRENFLSTTSSTLYGPSKIRGTQRPRAGCALQDTDDVASGLKVTPKLPVLFINVQVDLASEAFSFAFSLNQNRVSAVVAGFSAKSDNDS